MTIYRRRVEYDMVEMIHVIFPLILNWKPCSTNTSTITLFRRGNGYGEVTSNGISCNSLASSSSDS